MERKRVSIGDLTRKEFREMIQEGIIKAAIVPIASTEQHREHLEMIHDTASVTYMAQQVALKLYPAVVITPTIPVGVSEHWMEHPGTLTVRAEIFTEYVYDVCEALKRGGVRNILILNGHGGNVRPIMARIDEFRQKLGINLWFNSYWDMYEPAHCRVLEKGGLPGHACEYETSMALALFPERVHKDAIDDELALLGRREKGEALIQPPLEGLVEVLQKLLAGEPIDRPPVTFREGVAYHMVTGELIRT